MNTPTCKSFSLLTIAAIMGFLPSVSPEAYAGTIFPPTSPEIKQTFNANGTLASQTIGPAQLGNSFILTADEINALGGQLNMIIEKFLDASTLKTLLALLPALLLADNSGDFQTQQVALSGGAVAFEFTPTATPITSPGTYGNFDYAYGVAPTSFVSGAMVEYTFVGNTSSENLFQTATIVPEPTSLIPFVIGVLGVIGYGWRRAMSV